MAAQKCCDLWRPAQLEDKGEDTPFVPNYTFYPTSVSEPDIAQPGGFHPLFHESDLWQCPGQGGSGDMVLVQNYTFNHSLT